MELKGKKINFLGDSITEGHGVSTVDNVFWNVLARKTGAVCRGYGIGGTRIAIQTKPSEEAIWDMYFLSRVDGMEPDADAVVIFGGTNDFGHGDAPMGTFEDRTMDTFYGALHLTLQGIIEKYPDASIVYITPMPRCDDEVAMTKGGVFGTYYLADYVKAAKEVTAYYSIPTLDFFTSCGMQPKVDIIRERFIPDGLHPNDAGHARMASLVEGFLKAL